MTDLIYLDYNCFQRGFDDLRQTRIKMEALACQEILTQAEANQSNKAGIAVISLVLSSTFT